MALYGPSVLKRSGHSLFFDIKQIVIESNVFKQDKPLDSPEVSRRVYETSLSQHNEMQSYLQETCVHSLKWEVKEKYAGSISLQSFLENFDRVPHRGSFLIQVQKISGRQVCGDIWDLRLPRSFLFNFFGFEDKQSSTLSHTGVIQDG